MISLDLTVIIINNFLINKIMMETFNGTLEVVRQFFKVYSENHRWQALELSE